MTFERVRKILAEQLSISEAKIQPTSKIVDDLQADSLDMVELISEIESEFDISVSDDDIAKLVTVQDVVDFLTNLNK